MQKTLPQQCENSPTVVQAVC